MTLKKQIARTTSGAPAIPSFPPFPLQFRVRGLRSGGDLVGEGKEEGGKQTVAGQRQDSCLVLGRAAESRGSAAPASRSRRRARAKDIDSGTQQLGTVALGQVSKSLPALERQSACLPGSACSTGNWRGDDNLVWYADLHRASPSPLLLWKLCVHARVAGSRDVGRADTQGVQVL